MLMGQKENLGGQKTEPCLFWKGYTGKLKWQWKINLFEDVPPSENGYFSFSGAPHFVGFHIFQLVQDFYQVCGRCCWVALVRIVML